MADGMWFGLPAPTDAKLAWGARALVATSTVSTGKSRKVGRSWVNGQVTRKMVDVLGDRCQWRGINDVPRAERSQLAAWIDNVVWPKLEKALNGEGDVDTDHIVQPDYSGADVWSYDSERFHFQARGSGGYLFLCAWAEEVNTER